MLPNRLFIPSVHVEGTIVTSHAVHGELVIPTQLWRVAWYDQSAPVDSTVGTTILASHVNLHGQRGVFYLLAYLQKGALIAVTGPKATHHLFSVTQVARYPKTGLPDDLFDTTSSPHRLALVTCGGPFDASTGHYRDNVVVYATQIG